MIPGIDVSHFQGAIDCAQVAASGVVFAYIKASEGKFIKDPLYSSNYASLRQNQVVRGAYHFFHPQVDSQAQASNFLEAVNQLAAGDLPPALDVEITEQQSPNAIAAAMQQWLDAVEQTLGRAPVIYTSPSFWNTALAGTTAFAGYPLWVAEYTSNPEPKIPPGFSDYVFWQYSQTGSVPGILGSVDQDWFNGSIDDLNQLAGL
jgi:lysozyme